MTVGALVLSAAAWGPALDLGRDRGNGLSVLIGPGRTGETKAVRAAVREWSAASGRGASVAVAADMPRKLSRGFANGNPPDVFALGTGEFSAYATRGFLRPYGDDLGDARTFHPALVEAFSVGGDLICAPRTSDAEAPPLPQCWGIAADSPNYDAAVDLVRHLTRSAQESAG